MEHASSSKSDMFQDCFEPPKVSVKGFGRTASSVSHRNYARFLMSDPCARLWDKLDALHNLKSIDVAFDQLECEPYADAVVQAYFSMFDSDSDSGSEVVDEQEVGNYPISANLTALSPSVHPTPALSDFVTSCSMSEIGRGAVNELSRSIKSAESQKPPFPQFRKQTRTRSAKVVWDMVLLHKIDDIPKWAVTKNASSLRHHHSVLLYEQNVDHKEFTGLVKIKCRLDEREKLIDRIVNECGAISLFLLKQPLFLMNAKINKAMCKNGTFENQTNLNVDGAS
ncbi:hypothetical protein HDU77_010375 [Chytriomyces hyalinus]|nr:hypothetical protein HDU77_010375 [Chytriomyces hyalinus]